MDNQERQHKRQRSKAQLDALGLKWVSLQGWNNLGARKKTELEILELMYDLYLPAAKKSDSQLHASDEFDLTSRAIADLLTIYLPKFDPAKGTLSSYFTFKLEKRKIDLYNQDQDTEHQITLPGKDGEKTVISASYVSADKPINHSDSEGKIITVGDTIGDLEGHNDTVQGDWELLLDSWCLELYLLIQSLETKLSGHQKSGKTARHYRMFFTDNVLSILKMTGIPDCFRKRERDLFTTMDVPFLDYVTAWECRTLPQIRKSPLKTLDLLIPGHKLADTELPLANEVFVAYTKAAKSTISDQRAAYVRLLKEHTSGMEILS